MKITAYTVTAPVFVRSLQKLSELLDKAEQFAKEKGMEEGAILTAQLAPDQFPFVRQIQIASDNAKGCVARLTGTEIPKFADDEKTFAELKARIAKTIEFINGIPKEKFEGGEERMVELPYFDGKHFNGFEYLTEYALPNFFFHKTTAYAILRHLGVQIGKMDFVGPLSLRDKG